MTEMLKEKKEGSLFLSADNFMDFLINLLNLFLSKILFPLNHLDHVSEGQSTRAAPDYRADILWRSCTRAFCEFQWRTSTSSHLNWSLAFSKGSRLRVQKTSVDQRGSAAGIRLWIDGWMKFLVVLCWSVQFCVTFLLKKVVGLF